MHLKHEIQCQPWLLCAEFSQGIEAQMIPDAGEWVSTALSCLVGSFGASGLHLWDQGLKRPSLTYLQYYLDHQFLISSFSLILIPNRETSSLEMYFTLEQLQHCSKAELVSAGLSQDSAHFCGSLRRLLRSRHFHFTHFKATKQYANWGKLRRFANIFMKTVLKSVTWS